MTPRIFYYCYSHQRPTGGQKHTYRHVDILTAHGFDAYAFHEEEGFRLEWFGNDTRVIGPREFSRLYDPARDFVVVPEDLRGGVTRFGGRCVVFDKNVFLGFRELGPEPLASYPCQSPSVVAVLAVSEHNVNVLRFAYPDVPVFHVSSEIRPDLYPFRPLARKKPLIVSSRKGKDSLLGLYHIINARAAAGRNRARQFEWVFLNGQSEAQTATLLQDALLLLHLSGEEGLPRLPREAMACGCLVAAYDDGPLRECTPARSLFRHGDLTAVARFVEAVIDSFPNALDRWNGVIQEGLAIARRYSLERQEESVLSAWEAILESCETSAVPAARAR